MFTESRQLVGACLLAVLATGCRREVERGASGAFSPPALPPPGASAHPGSSVGSFADRQLALLLAGTNSQRVGPAERGVLGEGARASHTFEVLAHRCHRIVAAGGAEVNDLDLTLFDPSGVELDSDRDNQDYPTLGVRRPFCPTAGGRYRVEVAMHSGRGEYVVQVLRTP